MAVGKKAKRLAALAVVLAAGLGYAGYDYFKAEAPSYMTVTPKIRDIRKQVFATGTLAGQTQVDVGARVSGQIVKLYVDTGDEVKKGDLLCEIDPKIQETALKTAQAQIKIIEADIVSKQAEIVKLKLEHQRQVRLKKYDATSSQDAEVAEAAYKMGLAELDSLKAQYEQAQLSVDDATTNLGYTKITAPMDGTVYAMVVSEGQTVNANQTTPTILRLATMDKMKVEAEISEADVVNVKPGMECTFTILGLPFRTFNGKLGRIAPAPADYESSSSSSGSSSSSSSSSSTSTSAIYYNSDVYADNADRMLRIDMTADITINVDSRRQVLSLPLTALRNEQDGRAEVYVLKDDGSVDKTEIKTGLKDSQYIEILGGLNDDAKVVIGDDVNTAASEALQNTRMKKRGPI